MEQYNSGTPEEFWALFPTEYDGKGNAKPLTFTALVETLRINVNSGAAAEVEVVRREYGPAFDDVFVHGSGKRAGQPMTDNLAIVKRARRLDKARGGGSTTDSSCSSAGLAASFAVL